MMTMGQHGVRELRKTNKSWQMFTFREHKGKPDSMIVYTKEGNFFNGII